MWFRLFKGYFIYQKKNFLLLMLSVMMGTAVISSFLTIYLKVSREISLELRRYGANILMEPSVKGGFLAENDLIAIKSIFWRHNITGFAPYLNEVATVSRKAEEKGIKAVLSGTWFRKTFKLSDGQDFTTGLRGLAPYWQVTGKWPADNSPDEVLAGYEMAKKLGLKTGDALVIKGTSGKAEVRITGILKTGSTEEEQLFAPLKTVQMLFGHTGQVSKVSVSAVTVPMDELGRKNPKSMTRREYDKWYCTAYVTSVSKQLEEVMKGGKARPVWKVVEAEGRVLDKFSLILLILTIAALMAAAFAVATTSMVNVIRREKEISLLKALGADRRKIVIYFLMEGVFVGIAGGLLGYLGGIIFSQVLGREIFGRYFDITVSLLPSCLLSSLFIVFIGLFLPLKRALDIEAGLVLKT